MVPSQDVRSVRVVLFEGFELLDVFGPIEMFGQVSEYFQFELVGASAYAETAYADALTPDIVLVPGGIGTRRMVKDINFLSWLADWASTAEFVTSVCTGSAVLAAAGLLDGYRATSNKRAFDWARSQSNSTEWVAKARWIHDRSRWTSAGVAAGMDMALGLIAHLHGGNVANQVRDVVEYDWHQDATWDPFAATFGLDV